MSWKKNQHTLVGFISNGCDHEVQVERQFLFTQQADLLLLYRTLLIA